MGVTGAPSFGIEERIIVAGITGTYSVVVFGIRDVHIRRDHIDMRREPFIDIQHFEHGAA